MRSPFPGMDPYLEDPRTWHPFHTLFVSELARHCSPLLPDLFYVSVEHRSYVVIGDDPEEVQLPDALVVGRPFATADRTPGAVAGPSAGVEVLVPAPDTLDQRYLVIRDRHREERVVTAIEVLSPSNKRPGFGRDDYALKRGRVLSSRTNLVEIDLLRAGPRMSALGAPEGTDYSLLIARAATRPRAQLITFGVRDRLPELPIPLDPGDVEPQVSLDAVFSSVYETGRYGMRIDYREEPEPPLKAEDKDWADEFLRQQGLR